MLLSRIANRSLNTWRRTTNVPLIHNKNNCRYFSSNILEAKIFVEIKNLPLDISSKDFADVLRSNDNTK